MNNTQSISTMQVDKNLLKTTYLQLYKIKKQQALASLTFYLAKKSQDYLELIIKHFGQLSIIIQSFILMQKPKKSCGIF